MKNKMANEVKNKLMNIIHKIANKPDDFVLNPEKDFTRERKLPLKTMLKTIIGMGGGSMGKEMLEWFNYDPKTATTSAFSQQRDKIKPEMFEYIMKEITQTAKPKLWNGYRLLAVDGSDVHTPTNPELVDSYFGHNPNAKGYNLYHLNAIYDLQSKLFLDALIQPSRLWNEHSALCKMVDRSMIINKAILTADRGYESYNNLAHLEEKGWNYVISMRDSKGIISCIELPDTDEFDINVSIILTRKQTKEVKTQPKKYRLLPSNVNFDFLPPKSDELYQMNFRIVRFRLENGTLETLITNLKKEQFSSILLKDLYRLRWGIETSFRELKYAVGLLSFHSKKQNFIFQEIFASLILYNFSMMIVSFVILNNKENKYDYQINFTKAIDICRHFYRCILYSYDMEILIAKFILPIRPNRSFKRKTQAHCAVSFIYRMA